MQTKSIVEGEAAENIGMGDYIIQTYPGSRVWRLMVAGVDDKPNACALTTAKSGESLYIFCSDLLWLQIQAMIHGEE